jgi:hypothetical protein
LSRLSVIAVRQAACSSLSNIALPEAWGSGHSIGPNLAHRAVSVQAELRRGGRAARGTRESPRAKELGQLKGPESWSRSQWTENHEKIA